MEDIFHSDRQFPSSPSRRSSASSNDRKSLKVIASLFDSIRECVLSQDKSYLLKPKSEEMQLASIFSKSNPNLQLQGKSQVAKTTKTKQEVMCLIHSKPLDIICLKDESLICANCAIFGHKGHYFKSLKEFQQEKLSYCKIIVDTLCQRETLHNKITSKQTKNTVKGRLTIKKQQMIREIKNQYQLWYKILEQSQNSSIEKVIKHIDKLQRIVVKEKLVIGNRLESQYKQWHQHADKQMQIFESHGVDEQIKVMNYLKRVKEYDVEENGVKILEQFERVYKDGIVYLEREIEKLRVNVDVKMIGIIKGLTESLIVVSNKESINNVNSNFNELLTQSLKLSSNNSNIELNNSKSPHNSKQQQPIDNLGQDLLIQSSNKIPKLTQIDQNKPILPWDISSPLTPYQYPRNRLISIQSQTSDLTRSSIIHSKFQSPTKKRSTSKSKHLYNFSSSKSSITSPRAILSSSIKTTSHRTPRTLSEQKYEHIINNIIKSNSNTLNLDGHQLGDIKMVQILQKLRCVKIRTAVLSKNKLSDQFVEKMWSLMPHVETVNLSNNNLTDRILNNMLTTRRLQKNKNLVLYGNKIKEKESKFKVEALHRLGVHIEM